MGRTYGTATRKKLRAHVWISPSQHFGDCLVDGMPYHQVLDSMRDRFILTRPFYPSLLGDFNVFVHLESAFSDKQ